MRTLIRTALALAFLVGISPPLVAGTEPVCLLTGFEPFGGSKINPLWEVAKSLDGRRIGGFKVVSRQLPVVYDKVGVALENAIAETKPDMVISLGVGSSVIQIEKMARNGYHPKKIKDNAGLAPPREEIIPGGKATLETALPVEGILASLSKASIGARSSTNDHCD